MSNAQRWTALALAAVAILVAAYMGRYSPAGGGILDRWTGGPVRFVLLGQLGSAIQSITTNPYPSHTWTSTARPGTSSDTTSRLRHSARALQERDADAPVLPALPHESVVCTVEHDTEWDKPQHTIAIRKVLCRTPSSLSSLKHQASGSLGQPLQSPLL